MWVQAFAFDASNQQGDGVGADGDRDGGGGFLSEGDGDAPEDMAALQMECTVHEVLLKNQVRFWSRTRRYQCQGPRRQNPA